MTEILDEEPWWAALRIVIGFLPVAGLRAMNVRFGFVLARHLAGLEQGKDQTVSVENLERFVEEGLREGTIEQASSSDFELYSDDETFGVMLCNDDDIHFAAADFDLAMNLARRLKASGITVHVGPEAI